MAALAFGLAVAYRLEQEVWSNSLVVASFYGPVHSPAWWAAAVVSTAIPLIYCFTGGMRASLFTDVFQVGSSAGRWVAWGRGCRGKF
jgi:Na+/proline symporter